MPNLHGRPLKYKKILEALEPHTLYIPASIVAFAEEKGLLPESPEVEEKIVKQRIRISLGRLSNNHRFPDEGDGQVKKKGQRPIPGWFGWRWQEVVTKKNRKKKGGKK